MADPGGGGLTSWGRTITAMKIPGRRPPIPEGDEAIEPLVLPEPPNPDFYDPAWDAWKPRRSIPTKYVITGLAVIVVILGSIYLVRELTKSSPPAHAAKPSLTPTTYSIPQEAGAPSPAIFSGDQSQTTASFSVPSGLSVLSATCECTGTTFIVRVMEPNGTTATIPINSLGAEGAGIFAGSVPLGVGAGTYTLDVTASGKWTAKIITPPANQPAAPDARLYTSTGPSVFGPYPAGHAYGVLYSVANQPSPVSLQVVYSDGTVGPTVFTTAGTLKISGASIPAQFKTFYLAMSDTQSAWAVRVAKSAG